MLSPEEFLKNSLYPLRALVDPRLKKPQMPGSMGGMLRDEVHLAQVANAVVDNLVPAKGPAPKPLLQRKKDLRQQLKLDIAGDAMMDADMEFGGGMGWGGGGMGGRMGFFRKPFRIYAHQVRPNRVPGQRFDFTETLYWNAGVRTDENGQASFEFGLSDAVTEFRVLTEAFGDNGALGSADLNIESVEPFYLEPTLPLEVTVGDKINLPIGFVNSTSGNYDSVVIDLKTDSSLSIFNTPKPFTLNADSRIRQMIGMTVGQHNGSVEVSIGGTAGSLTDNVTRTLIIRPQGFPIAYGQGGLLAANNSATHQIAIPESLVGGSIETRIAVHPTPLASLTEALEALIREPCGCFEQTSSSVYPLIMAQQYFKSHQGVDPELITRSSEILARGYEKLLSFESPGHGFEWFGSDPGHDALTAYGLMEFTDMATVRNVDQAMLARTRDWLLAQRDGKGGYERKTNTLHTWLAEPEIANSYNTWALLEAGVDADLSTEVEWVREAASTSDNTYVLALGANVLLAAGNAEAADRLLQELADFQEDNGSLRGATRSVVGSTGEALLIETTALAVKAWLKNPRFAHNVEKSIKFLAESCKSGRFGSTQSTVLALKAIMAYDKSRSKPKAAGSLQLIVDGKATGEPVAFDKDSSGAIVLPEIAELLSAGKHTIKVAMTDGSEMPYSISVRYNCLKPVSDDNCDVDIQVSLSDKSLEEGTTTEANVVVVNQSDEEVASPMAIVGIPGGLEVRHDQLKELKSSGKIAAYEVRGRDVVLYWRMLEPKQRVELPISLLAAVPGTYTGPASRAYLYYTDEHKHWVEALSVEIQPKGQVAAVSSN